MKDQGTWSEEEGGQRQPRQNERGADRTVRTDEETRGQKNQEWERGSTRDQAGRIRERQRCPTLVAPGAGMQVVLEGGPKDKLLERQKHPPIDLGGAHNHPTQHWVFLKLCDHSLQYDEDGEG